MISCRNAHPVVGDIPSAEEMLGEIDKSISAQAFFMNRGADSVYEEKFVVGLNNICRETPI